MRIDNIVGLFLAMRSTWLALLQISSRQFKFIEHNLPELYLFPNCYCSNLNCVFLLVVKIVIPEDENVFEIPMYRLRNKNEGQNVTLIALT